MSHAPPQSHQMRVRTSDLTRAARRFGTPVYVLDMASIAAAASEIESAFGGWLLHYSLKANDLPAIAGYLGSRGWSAAVVSTGEWQCASAGGLRNDAVVFEGIGKTDAQLEYAVAETAAGRPVRWLVIESADEFDALSELAAAYGLGRGKDTLDVLFRLNPAVHPETLAEFAVGRVTSKFGMPAAEIRRLARGGARPGLRLRGIHVHVGSALNDVVAWAEGGVAAVKLLNELEQSVATADTVDFGGGFPLPGPGVPGPAEFRAALVDALTTQALAPPRRPAIEPGRYLVGSAGWLVASVLHAREPVALGQGGQPQVILDAGMTELIRPALYGSTHDLHALTADRWPDDAFRATAVEGPICESTDSFGNHALPPLGRGDLVAFEHAGAYGASLTSRYNGRPQPAEVLLWPDGSLERRHRPEIEAPMPNTPQTSQRAELVPAVGQASISLPQDRG